jgi:hypothetical protein
MVWYEHHRAHHPRHAYEIGSNQPVRILPTSATPFRPLARGFRLGPRACEPLCSDTAWSGDARASPTQTTRAQKQVARMLPAPCGAGQHARALSSHALNCVPDYARNSALPGDEPGKVITCPRTNALEPLTRARPSAPAAAHIWHNGFIASARALQPARAWPQSLYTARMLAQAAPRWMQPSSTATLRTSRPAACMPGDPAGRQSVHVMTTVWFRPLIPASYNHSSALWAHANTSRGPC